MKKATVHLAASFSMLIWGISYIWSKQVFEFYTPLTAIFLRLFISCIFLFFFIRITNQKEKIKKEDFLLFLAGSFFNPFLYFLGESHGLNLVSASVSALLIATIPVFTPLLAFIIFKEKLSKLNIVGLFVSFAGIFIIIFNKNLQIEGSSKGIALLFLAVASAVIYSIFVKYLVNKYKPVTIIFYQNLIGALFFLPLFVYFDASEFPLKLPDSHILFALLMLGIFASSFAYLLYVFVIKKWG